MEILDICDESGIPTGQTVTRDQAHEEGILHRTVHIWVAHRNGPYVFVLLQKRASHKDSFPDCYDTSAAGHIQAGDEPIDSAIRELKEELGITATKDQLQFIGMQRFEYQMPFHGKDFHDNEVAYTYLYEDKVDIDSLSLQTDEVSEVKWFGTESLYFSRLLGKPGFCVPSTGLELVRKHYLPHVISPELKQTKHKIDVILQKTSPDCLIGFLNTIALIHDSYKIKSRKDRLTICRLIADSGLTKRTAENLSAEWYVHNLAYYLHVGRSHAKDVDLDYDQDPRLAVRLATAIFEKLHLY